MGILKLMDFLKAKFPKCIKDVLATDLSGKTIAIDASNVIYQFLVQTQVITTGNNLNMPTDIYGNKTGHLVGLMARVSFYQENNIKTVWVFDGKPPTQKFNQLSRRSKIKKEAEQKMQQAIVEGDLLQALKHQKRTMKISKVQKQYAVKMLSMMGLPTIQAPSQSEAQCAYLSQIGLVDGVATQDMDCLALGTQYMYKSISKTKSIKQINLKTILQQTKLSIDEFIDLCIMCGCDYTGRISNIGPVRAYDLLLKHRSIQKIIESLNIPTAKFRIDTEFDYVTSRKLFKQPLVEKNIQQFEWKKPEKENLKQFLQNLDFSHNRINNWIQKAEKFSF